MSADTQARAAAAWEQLYRENKRLRHDAEARLDKVRDLLEQNGCDCYCYCDTDGHASDDCEPCLACLIQDAVGS